MYQTHHDPPGPSRWKALRTMRAFQRNPLTFLSELDRDYGGIVRFYTALLPVYLISRPDAVEHVLQKNARNYSKNTFTYNMARKLTGVNLLTSDGSDWLRRRRLIQPLLHHKYIGVFAETIGEIIQEMLARWEKQRTPFNLTEEMMRLTLHIAGKTLFGVDLEGETTSVREALNISSNEVMGQFRSPLAALWTLFNFPSPSSQQFKRAAQQLDTLLNGLIAQRRRQQELPYDILSLLIQTVDEETGEGLSDAEIRNEVGILLMAGHETTALALTWCWILLAQHPSAQVRLHTEIDSLPSDSVALSDLSALPYTQALFQEALRLYPPAWGFSRRAVADDLIGGYYIPAGARIMLSPFVTHHSSHYWQQPEQFVPERFLSGQQADQPRFAYLPFGGGPRQCIGNSFAIMEARLILAAVAQRFHLRVNSPTPIQPIAQGTLRPHQPVWVSLESR